MGRPKRAADGGLVYHVLNRANARMTIFEDDEDYAAFEQVLEQAVERTQMRLLAYCSQSLALRAVARARQGTGGLHATAHNYARSALAGAPGTGGPGPCVPWSLQILPRRDRQVLLSGDTVCGTKRVAGRPGIFGRAVALVQPLAPYSRFGRATGFAQSLAPPPPSPPPEELPPPERRHRNLGQFTARRARPPVRRP